MLLRRWGRIINVSSPSARMPLAGQSSYAASKAGLEGLTRALSRDLAAKGVLVNAVSPGLVETEMLDAMPAEGRAAHLKAVAIGRVGHAPRSRRPRRVSRVGRGQLHHRSGDWRGRRVAVAGCEGRLRLNLICLIPRMLSRPNQAGHRPLPSSSDCTRGDRRRHASLLRGRAGARFDRRARARAGARAQLRRGDPRRGDGDGGAEVGRHDPRLHPERAGEERHADVDCRIRGRCSPVVSRTTSSPSISRSGSTSAASGGPLAAGQLGSSPFARGVHHAASARPARPRRRAAPRSSSSAGSPSGIRA